MILGSPQMEAIGSGRLARELDAVVVSPDYRLAAEDPFPAALDAQRAHDEGIALRAQALVYPMIDDRTVLQENHGERGRFVWTPKANRFAWAGHRVSWSPCRACITGLMAWPGKPRP